ncbi:putative transmembrane protein [Pseudogulbenkiania sp. NH8B]|uniref:FimV/HubP family polar landmark protein n=1 Tax=Pseudogulbenkiania sp. (strain NH8B) TaxID=748280 RepID=UPI0002279A1F|nr:FimV/HubP family polar landmark protein [Pseudogulbenkiania sp. NH8B]BAK76318.1 putative transmembrane protein [Pseudogulbenkiania sp. NH8B]
MKLSALAVAVLFSANAWAGLGKINVRSYLGETFRAEINLTDVNAAELSSARVGLAGMDTFRDLNVDYSGILSSLKFSVEPSGRGAIVRVSSSAPINEPYLRFVVEARTSSGRSVREYTVLLDPIDYQVSNKPSFVQSLPKAAPSLASQYRGNVAREGAVAPRRTSADSLYVAPGATLNTLAAQVRPQGATLEQTMAALVKNNPSAFIAGDPNRIKAAVNLKVPPAAKIRAIAPAEARHLLAPASALAANAAPPAAQASPEPPPAAAPKPAAAATQAAQPAKGGEVLKLMAPETSAPTDEKLSDVEQQVASREQALKDAEKRIATLEAQIKALQNSHEVAKPAAGGGAKTGDAAAGPSWVDSLVDNLPLVGGGAAIALLAALGVVVARRRRQAPSLSSALKLSSGNAGAVLGSGASSNINLQGGASAIGGGHSFMANFTQSVGAIDTAEVDPIAEAEVYIAYGRDAQAEEILKDALSRDPSRHEVRLKLMEIHAGRQDKEGFESLARELYAAFDGKGPHWAKAAAMGAVLDPGNPLYQLLDSAPGASAQTAAPAAAIDLDHELFGQPSAPASPPMPAENAAAPREPAKAPSAPVTQSSLAESDDPLRAALFAEAPPSGLAEEANPGNMLDFDLDAAFDLSAKKPEAGATQGDPAASEAMQENLLDFDFNLDSMLSEPSGKAGQQGKADTAPDLGLEETGSAGFDALYEGMLGAESAPEAASLEGLSVNDDPLSTKLDLAKVYLDMGDKDGAKEVLEDLLSEAQGGLKAEAEQLLAKIGS